MAVGISKGAELALAAASHSREINGVIALSPASRVNMGIGSGISWVNSSSWTFKGKELPYAYAKVPGWRAALKSIQARELTFRFVYEEDGKIYFHGAKEGHKIDSIVKCDKVCFCVYDKGYKKEGDWALNIKSVVIFGRIRLVTDTEKAKEICTNICRKFTDDEEYIQKELNNALSRVQCLELIPEHMTGKLVNES